jgi:hypothetical protein
VPLVSKPFSFACRAERLTGTTTRPDWSIVRPSGESKSVAPPADTGEEMALCVACEIGRIDIFNRPLIDNPIGDNIRFNEFT